MVGAVLPVHDAEHALFLDVLALAADGLRGLEADECFAVPEICGFSVLVPIFRVVMLAAELLGETIVVRPCIPALASCRRPLLTFAAPV